MSHFINFFSTLPVALKRGFLVFSCLILLTGCSSTKLAYNFLDFLLNWYVGNYISLEKSQKETTRNAIDDFHSWHQRTQLPLYANYIEGLIARLENDNITAEFIHKETDQVQDMVDISFNHLKPAIAELLASLSEEQAEELLKNLKKNRDKFKKKYLDISKKKLFKKREDTFKDNASSFFGRFSKQQKQSIELWSKTLTPYEALTLVQQQTWADELASALTVRHNRTTLAGKLDKLMFYRTDEWSPKLEKILDYNQQLTYTVIAQLVNTRSDKQRKKMTKKLRSYQSDFIELSQKK
ncbi:MAG: hypothetical protein ACI9Y1_001467 [Lentisphaeria bacterium]|jgi:hypothetical protein